MSPSLWSQFFYYDIYILPAPIGSRHFYIGRLNINSFFKEIFYMYHSMSQSNKTSIYPGISLHSAIFRLALVLSKLSQTVAPSFRLASHGCYLFPLILSADSSIRHSSTQTCQQPLVFPSGQLILLCFFRQGDTSTSRSHSYSDLNDCISPFLNFHDHPNCTHHRNQPHIEASVLTNTSSVVVELLHAPEVYLHGLLLCLN